MKRPWWWILAAPYYIIAGLVQYVRDLRRMGQS